MVLIYILVVVVVVSDEERLSGTLTNEVVDGFLLFFKLSTAVSTNIAHMLMRLWRRRGRGRLQLAFFLFGALYFSILEAVVFGGGWWLVVVVVVEGLSRWCRSRKSNSEG